LKNREVETFLPAFLDEIVFRYGPPERIHSDSAPEFMSEAMNELADALEIELPTTMGHRAHSNGIVEVFWRFWNRCMRLLPDDHYKKWPAFKSRICFAFNTAARESLSKVAPHEIYFGAPARNAFTYLLPFSFSVLISFSCCNPGLVFWKRDPLVVVYYYLVHHVGVGLGFVLRMCALRCHFCGVDVDLCVVLMSFGIVFSSFGVIVVLLRCGWRRVGIGDDMLVCCVRRVVCFFCFAFLCLPHLGGPFLLFFVTILVSIFVLSLVLLLLFLA
jgi:hypothetical protein